MRWGQLRKIERPPSIGFSHTVRLPAAAKGKILVWATVAHQDLAGFSLGTGEIGERSRDET